jgi:hypothetical protein
VIGCQDKGHGAPSAEIDVMVESSRTYLC